MLKIMCKKSIKVTFNPNYRKLFNRVPSLVSKNFSVWVGSSNLDIAAFGVIVKKKILKVQSCAIKQNAL